MMNIIVRRADGQRVDGPRWWRAAFADASYSNNRWNWVVAQGRTMLHAHRTRTTPLHDHPRPTTRRCWTLDICLSWVRELNDSARAPPFHALYASNMKKHAPA